MQSQRMPRVLLLAAVVSMSPMTVLGQTAVANPTRLVFVASTDHNAVTPVSGEAVVTGYRAKYWLATQCNPACPTTGTPAFTLTLGKPTPATNGEIVVNDVFQGLVLNQVYKAQVEAFGPGGATASAASNPFGRETVNPPAATGAPRAERAGS